MDMDTPSASLFNKLKWMTVYQRVRYQNLLLAYKVLNHLTPNYLIDTLNWKIYNHQYSLRSNLNAFIDLNISDVKMEIYKQSFSFCGVLSWNALPDILKSELTFSALKKI